MRRNKRLDELFNEWRSLYPQELQGGFHPDGIVDEATWDVQQEQILYVLAEPNSRRGLHDKFSGQDLRPVFGQWQWTKSININIARWTNCILDGQYRAVRIDGEQADASNRRVAIMNLKKLSGAGVADQPAIAIDAWNRRDLIRRQVRIIAPTVIVACKKLVNTLLYRIAEGDEFAGAPWDVPWRFNDAVVIPSHHPSLRNRTQAQNALTRIRQLCETAKIGAFRNTTGR